MRAGHSIPALIAAAGMLAFAFADEELVVLKSYPLDDTNGIIAHMKMSIDRVAGGGGSLRIRTRKPIEVPLFETGDIDVEEARLVYQAKMRVRRFHGGAYLEMVCHFPAGGEFVSRGIIRTRMAGCRGSARFGWLMRAG